MKVLEVFGEPILNGGQESFVINALKHMDMSDMRVDLLTIYYCKNPHYTQIVEGWGGSIYALNLPFEPGRSRNNIFKPLNEFLKENQYDAIHIHSGSISVLALASLCAKQNKIKKIVVHSHSTAAKKTWKYRVVKAFSTPIMATCPSDYCACSYAAGTWKFSHNITKKKLVILKNGVDLNQFAFDLDIRDKMFEQLRLEKSNFVVGHVGRFSSEKNHKFLVRIFEEVRKSNPSAKLLLVGEGETKQEIQELVKEKQLEEDVLFCGSVNNVYDYMQSIDVFVLPSLYEGLPIVGIEAQAAGIPMIASKNVPEELNLTDTVEFLSLTDSVDMWSQNILKHQGMARNENKRLLKERGYDICDTAARMREIYGV